jgi:hypothetical protein
MTDKTPATEAMDAAVELARAVSRHHGLPVEIYDLADKVRLTSGRPISYDYAPRCTTDPTMPGWCSAHHAWFHPAPSDD